ncbi:hypothetical protein TrVFT333_001751 [Trichoderma virens FT-333]|nr:hypothetical protein TrVFT333_001751 [Trichoderma virens FT-333]
MMASGSVSARLSRSETAPRKAAFRKYAQSAFDDRPERRQELPHLDVIEDEERRIKKIRERFKNKSSKLRLLENVAESRKELIPYLSEEAKKDKKNRPKRERHLSSPDEQEAARSSESINETEKTLSELEEPVDEFKAGIMYFEKEDDKKWQAPISTLGN